MSLVQRLGDWVDSFTTWRVPDVRAMEQQQREADMLLRQLRAELKLMRRWRETERESKSP